MMRGLLDSLPLKVISLAFAALLWLLIAGEKSSEMGISAKVELQNFPRELEITGEPVNEVEVRLRASPGMIQRIDPGEVSAQVDLQGVGEGEHIVHLTDRSIRMPFGVNVVKISPAVLTLRLERTMEKVVPVRPRLLGRPAEGFEVGEIASEPAEVRVAGPRTRVEELESAFTEPVSVDGARIDVSSEVTVGLEDPLLRIQVSPRVRVMARVREVQARRTVTGVAVVVAGGGGARPATIAVDVSGPAEALARLTAGDFLAVADAAAGKSLAMIPVTVAVREGVTGVTIQAWQPTEVAVRKTP